MDELAMELLLLLVILPAVQDQNQGREWLKYLVQRYYLNIATVPLGLSNKISRWCEGVSWVLSLQSYMFGDSQEAVEVEVRGEEDEEEFGEVRVETSFQMSRYIPRLRWFPIISMRKALEQLTKHCFRGRDPRASSLSTNPSTSVAG